MKNALSLISTITRVDSYKFSQFAQYPKGTTHISSYIESRGGEDESVFFGLQAFIKDYLLTPVTMKDVDRAEKIVTAHGLPFNREGWEIIVKEYGGKLPNNIPVLHPKITSRKHPKLTSLVYIPTNIPNTSHVNILSLHPKYIPITS